MNIIVLVKQTFDTEEKIVIKDGKVVDDDVKFVLNPYDEYAVEEAIRIRDDQGGKVTVVSVGTERTIEALRTALAMGADEAVLINDDRIGTDEHAVAQALAAFVGTESADLVLGGNFSVDNGAGQVAVRMAKLLGIPHVSAITKLDIADGRAVGSRDAEGDTEVVELPLPALFTAQQGLNEPRYPSLQGIMKAKKKPLRELTLDDFGVTAEARTAQTELFLPPQRQAGKLLSGEPAAQAQELFRLLRTEAKVV
ncbi:electron transfer flavoprotein beta subunit/FixA family protein [Paenibacillus dendritiformis]|uniref:electron transfer flavoprotein subunit beta/FixA family protein n=1 Tax=Paenibacillus dendritiformis TaxID=130049 RepID=UPI001059BCB3|nr:electron transfer flavoprotein subunit beta/FixA family protein [Paenibacillus dendritiformis]TDL50210.1 electron transfer flavoprotein beta subunit/FixA family protein [Paenibacillus dendritiformis]